MFDFSQRADDVREFMDDPACDAKSLQTTYAQFASINRWLTGWRSLYRTRLRPRLARGREHSILDIGFGGGDLLRSLVQWARRDGFDLRGIGIEPDARAVAFARQHRAAEGIEFRHADAKDVVESGERFDFVISNSVLHHLPTDEIRSWVENSARLARIGVLHNDIRRSRLAWRLFSIAAPPLFRGSFAAADGLTSIRRSLTGVELRTLLSPEWKVEERFPFRLLISRILT